MSEWDYTNERVLFWMDLNGDFEWVCSTITSQNIYGRAPTIILLTMRPSRLFVKIRCHAVPSTRKRSAPDGHGYELVSSVRALVPQKFSVEEELMHVKHVEVKSPHVGVMWKFGRGVISSAELAERWTELPQVSDESRSFFRVHTGYFSNIPKCIKAEFIASWACSQSSVVSSSQR
ncbi:core histone macro-H2A.1 [Trichonephila clavipes]|nr:core histone macro-H2A.1 [Trichonephila clavipes]